MVHILISILVVISFVVGGLGILFSKKVDGSYDRFFLIVGCLSLFLGLGIVYHRASGQHPFFSDTLPKGVESSDKVIKLALERSKLSYSPSIAERFGEDLYNKHQVQVMINPKTERYVFNYRFKGERIPVYAIYEKVNETYNAYLIPVKSNSKIDSLLVDGSVADKQIDAREYKGYSYLALLSLDSDDSFNGQDHRQKSYKDYEISYK